MTVQEFFDKYNNKGIDFDGAYGFQCMDLAHQYASECVGHDFAPAPAAKDVWNQDIDGYDKIANSPTGVPSRGDIVVWGTAIGVYGHIAIFDHGDANSFTSFDQNWPINSLCHYQNHNYTGVLGWFHPKNNIGETVAVDKKTFENVITKATEDDAFHAAGFNSPDDAKTQLNVVEAHNAQLQNQIDAMTKKNQDLEKGNNNLQTEVDTFSEQIKNLTEVNEKLNKQIETLSATQPLPSNNPVPTGSSNSNVPSQTNGSGLTDTSVANFFKAILAWLRGK